MSTRRILLAALFGCLVEGAAFAQTQSVEDEKVSPTTSTTFQDKAVLSFTANAGQYLIIETATFAASDTYALHTSPAYTQVQAVVDDVVYSKSNQYSNLGVSGTAGQPFTTWMGFAAHQLVTFTAGSPHTIKIQYSTTNSSYAAQIRNARIVAIPVSTSQSVEQTPIETATDVNTPNCCTYGTGTTVKTLTFTPPSTEDYLVLASAQIATNPSQNGCDYLAMIRLRQGTTDEVPVDPKEEMRYQPKPVGQVYRSYANMRKYSLAGGVPQTFRIQVDARSVTCNGITRHNTFIKDTRITAIPLSAMASGASGYAEVEAEASTTSSTLQTRVTGSVTATPSQPYVVLGMSFLKNAATSGSNGRCYQVNGHHDIGGAGAADVGYVCNSTDEYPSFFDMRQVSWPDSLSHSSFVSYDTQAGGTARIKNARVLMMPVVAASAGGGINPPVPGDIVRVFPSHNASALPFLKFTLSTGTNYTFSTTGGSAGADTVLHLLDPNGMQVGYNDDCGGTLLSKFPCTGSWSPSVAGDYTVMVRAYSSSSGGTVSLTQQIGTGTPISQGPFAFTKPWIAFGGQINGDTVTTVERWEGTEDTCIFLAQDEWTITQEDDDSGVDRMSKVKATLPATGAYVGGHIVQGSAAPGLVTVYVNDATKSSAPCGNNLNDLDCDDVGNLLEGQVGTCPAEPCPSAGIYVPTAGDSDNDGIVDGSELFSLEIQPEDPLKPLVFMKLEQWGARANYPDMFVELDWDGYFGGPPRAGWATNLANAFREMGIHTHTDVNSKDPNPPDSDSWGKIPRFFNGGGSNSVANAGCDTSDIFATERRGLFVHWVGKPGNSTYKATKGRLGCGTGACVESPGPIDFLKGITRTMGIREGGPWTEPGCKPNYLSVVNPAYHGNNAGVPRFSKEGLQPLTPTDLHEGVGVGTTDTPAFLSLGRFPQRYFPGGAVDWNMNGVIDSTAVTTAPNWSTAKFGCDSPNDYISADLINYFNDFGAGTQASAGAGHVGRRLYAVFPHPTGGLVWQYYTAKGQKRSGSELCDECEYQAGTTIVTDAALGSAAVASCAACEGPGGGSSSIHDRVIIVFGDPSPPLPRYYRIDVERTGTDEYTATPRYTFPRDIATLGIDLNPLAEKATPTIAMISRAASPPDDQGIYMVWIGPMDELHEAVLSVPGLIISPAVPLHLASGATVVTDTPAALVSGSDPGSNLSLVYRDPTSGRLVWLDKAGGVDTTGGWIVNSAAIPPATRLRSARTRPAALYNPIRQSTVLEFVGAADFLMSGGYEAPIRAPQMPFETMANFVHAAFPTRIHSGGVRDIVGGGGPALSMFTDGNGLVVESAVELQNYLVTSSHSVAHRVVSDGLVTQTMQSTKDADLMKAGGLCTALVDGTCNPFCGLSRCRGAYGCDQSDVTNDQSFLADQSILAFVAGRDVAGPVGFSDGTENGRAASATTPIGYAVAGPGITGLSEFAAPHSYVAHFRILVDDAADTAEVARLDVVNRTTGASLSGLEVIVRGTDFSDVGTFVYKDFEVPFTVPPSTPAADLIDFRVCHPGTLTAFGGCVPSDFDTPRKYFRVAVINVELVLP